MIRKPIIFVLFIFSIFLWSACSNNSSTPSADKDSSKIKKPFLKNITTIKAALSEQEDELTLSGQVECDPDKVINYTPLVNGVADRIYFSLGDKVQKGQTMLDIRSSDLSTLQSDYVSAEAEIKIAQRELTTAQSMYSDNMLSEKELIEAQVKLQKAQSIFTKIKNDISVQGTNKGNGVFSIKSPMSGYVVKKNVSSGSTISTEQNPLFTIADLSSVWITINIYAGNLLFVKEGMEVNITTLSYPGEVFTGKINSLSQVFDPEEKVLKARIVMPNKDLKFKPEMAVVVRLKNSVHAQYVSVPSDVLIFDDDRYFVVVQENENIFKIKEVKLHGHFNKTTYIQSGLSEGETVVSRNQLLIYSDLKEN